MAFLSPIVTFSGPIAAFLSPHTRLRGPIVTFSGPIAAFFCKIFFISPHNRFKGPYSGVFKPYSDVFGPYSGVFFEKMFDLKKHGTRAHQARVPKKSGTYLNISQTVFRA